MSWNVCKLNASKRNALLVLLHDHNPDVVTLQETDIPANTAAALSYSNYDVYLSPAVHEKVREIVLVRTTIKVQHLENLEAADYPLSWLRFPDYKLSLATVYRCFAPDTSGKIDREEKELKLVSDSVATARLMHPEDSLVLAGDLNGHANKTLFPENAYS